MKQGETNIKFTFITNIINDKKPFIPGEEGGIFHLSYVVVFNWNENMVSKFAHYYAPVCANDTVGRKTFFYGTNVKRRMYLLNI